MSFEPKYFLRIFWIRLPVFLVVFTLVLGVGAALALKLPKIYRAHATLLVETSQIPSDLAASTVRPDFGRQLQVTTARLTTRENLLDIADRFALYEDQPEMEPDEIAWRMSKRVIIDLRGGGNDASLVTIAAEAKDGATAADIANYLVDQFLNADAEFRNGIAAGTLAFFKSEVERLGSELDATNTRILEFQNANIDALPETLDFRLNRQALLQERVTQARREIGQLSEQRQRLISVFEATGRTESRPSRELTPDEQELETLRSQLNRAAAVFSDSHPRVQVLRARVAQLEKAVAGIPSDSELPGRPGADVLEAQLVELDSQIDAREEMSASLQQDIEALQATIDRTPANGVTLDSLRRNQSNIQSQYDTAVERLSTAATGERIEILSKGARLTVMEQAVVPASPAKPDRKMLAAVFGLLAASLGLGMVVLLEVLRPYIRRPVELTRALGITPIATLSYVPTPAELWRRWALRTALTAVVVFATVFGAGVLLQEYGGFEVFQRMAENIRVQRQL